MSLRDAALFGGFALAMHVGVFAWIGAVEDGGSAGGGAGGAADVTVLPQSGEIAALVERWTAPPETSTAMAALPMPEAFAPPAPVTAMPDAPPSRIARPADADPAEAAPDDAPSPQAPASPAPPKPRPSLAPEMLTALALPSTPALERPARPAETAPTRPQRPAALAVPGTNAETPPQAQTAPAAKPTPRVNPSEAAPLASARPAPRPPGLAPERPRPVASPAPAPAPAARAKPQAGRKAQGSGGAAAPARAAPAPAASGPSPDAIRTARAQWGASIRTAIARAQRYPRGTRATGRVTVRLNVTPSGRLISSGVVASSGNGALDRAALQATQRARLPRAPSVLSAASYAFDLPLSFARR
ncbi:Gram-negative bacterial tonB protein [Roseivivax sp. THAF40]|uniref:energy transducer TonB family protein n=1 Tax=unclassified Roseivivax TaxID=2639302 RepID=UPI0012681FB1|nr:MULTISPECIES: energy transducer TonB [unclassified Roseivivax]QFS83641.1 Gram-negative bacterial tonB protein [Roseivivax sp. THAF197b]QFT47449.1 Gram-negative bacterial tonB protein [Roseivivax sp. THAF40]